MMQKDEKIEYIDEESQGEDGKVQKLREALKQCKHERAEYLLGWQRARADFQNFTKEKQREISEFRTFAIDRAIRDIFPVLDNLILATDSLPQDLEENTWIKGIVQIRKQFESVLKDFGVEEMQVGEHEKFNPMLHEAGEAVESERESGTILAVVRSGYTLHGKVIRPARVKVAK